MSILAQYLQSNFHNDINVENIMEEVMRKDYQSSNDTEISCELIYTAQATLLDIDKSIEELSCLVENLRNQSVKLSKGTC